MYNNESTDTLIIYFNVDQLYNIALLTILIRHNVELVIPAHTLALFV